MRLAIIDLGTNSVRFDVHEIGLNRNREIEHRRLYREKAMVRLGQDLFVKGRLSKEGKRRTLEAVQSFHETSQALKVDQIVAFGTSAMRDASDGDQFLEELRSSTGVDFRIITGAEEASLIARGILENEKKLPKKTFALVDIGGGSTEISICRGKKALHSHSFNLGVARLQQVFLKSQPPQLKKKNSEDPVTALRKHVKSLVLTQSILEQWPKAQVLVGSSGSALALSKLLGNKEKFERKQLSKLIEQMRFKTPAELLAMKGMEPKRVDLILAGAILLDEIAHVLGAKTITSTEYSLRDGILAEELKRVPGSKKSKLNRGAIFSFAEIEKRMELWGVDLEHPKTVQTHAEWLFDQLSNEHKLKKEWRPYLSAAALLHDIGEVISHAHHADHSAYMIENANFIGIQPWESSFIALLAKHHKSEKKIPSIEPKELKPIYLKLLSLLQLSDAFDRAHKSHLKLVGVQKHGSTLDIRFKSKKTCDLELLRVEQKKSLFEEVFKKKIRMVRVR